MSTGTEPRKPAGCFTVVNHGREYSKARKGDVEYPRFVQFSAAICRISQWIQFSNNHEGSIPFTRSIDNRSLRSDCSKSAVKLSK